MGFALTAEPSAQVALDQVSPFPPVLRYRLRASLGLALQTLRELPAFRSLDRCAWMVFVAIATHWQGKETAYPSQETIARFLGYTDTSVRHAIGVLARSGLVRVEGEGERGRGGRFVVCHYAPGAATIDALYAFVRRYPKGEADGGPRRVVMRPRLVSPPEMVSGGPPEMVSEEPVQQKDLTSSAELEEAAPESGETSHEEEKSAGKGGGGRGDATSAIAREALTAYLVRKEPTITPPRLFRAEHVAMVQACAELVPGDEFMRILAMNDAIDGAWQVSKGREPTLGFIFGDVGHFLDHLKRGRGRRMASERTRERAAAPRTMPLELEPLPTFDELRGTFANLWEVLK
jgi:hypothetical protein